jgi:flagellar motor switch/type III secretory pathway protein FliN
MAKRVHAFPWGSLPVVARDADYAFRSAVATLVHYVDHSLLAAEVARFLPNLSVTPPRLASTSAVLPNAIAVRLSATDVLGETPGAIVEVDSAFAIAIVTRMLSRDPTPIVRERVLPDALAGAWTAVLMRVLRASSRQAAIVAFEAGLAERVSGAWIQHGVPHAVLIGSLTHAEQTYAYRILLGPHPLIAANSLTRRALLSMGSLPLRLPVVGAEGTLTREEFESLRSGDIWLPEVCHVASIEGKLDGNPLVATPDFGYAWRSTITGKDQLCVGPAKENRMTQGPDHSDALIASLGGAPITLRLELGSVELTAREWATLSPGAVLSTGLPIGARVILRAGSVAVAKGELVNVEGELGVRILETTP